MKEALEFSKTFRDKFFERKLFSESQKGGNMFILPN
jgi:hypothetical protein